MTVSTIQLTQSAGPVIAPAGQLATTVTATAPGPAHVDAAVTTYGPLAPTAGRCPATLDWRRAPIAGTSPSQPLAGHATLTAKVSGAKVTAVGCYALTTRSVITQDGKTLVVQTPVGQAGTTTQVLRPSLSITNNSTTGCRASR